MTIEERMRIKKRSCEELKELLLALKKERGIWTDKIEKALEYLEAYNMKETEAILTSLRDEADKYPRNSSGMGWSARMRAILKVFEDCAY